MAPVNYTIPSDNRELQLAAFPLLLLVYYTIPSDNRELQRFRRTPGAIFIIPYQVITGNYNWCSGYLKIDVIIPYQVITGNYNLQAPHTCGQWIIPYQVITGNYNKPPGGIIGRGLYHTK